MAKLFAQEVPRSLDGIVESNGCRDPVHAPDCRHFARFLGRSGRRLRRHARFARAGGVNEPGREDRHYSVVCGHPDLRGQRARACRVAKVVLDEERARIEVVVPDAHYLLPSDGAARNVRLASQLTGWDIDILTEQEVERRQAEFQNRTKTFIEALNVDEVVAQLLASEGFTSVEELALVDEKELASIEGFDDETAGELQNRAREYLSKIEGELDAKRKELGVADELKDIPGVSTQMLVKFGENGVKTVEDLAGCATDDLIGWTERKDGESKREPGILDGFEISRDEAETMIMQARLKAGWVTEADLAPQQSAETEPAQAAETQA